MGVPGLEWDSFRRDRVRKRRGLSLSVTDSRLPLFFLTFVSLLSGLAVRVELEEPGFPV